MTCKLPDLMLPKLAAQGLVPKSRFREQSKPDQLVQRER